jgi:hypothetical protein
MADRRVRRHRTVDAAECFALLPAQDTRTRDRTAGRYIGAQEPATRSTGLLAALVGLCLLDPQVRAAAVRVMEKVNGTPAAELGATFDMHARYDPHPALEASLADEPIPPAPDGEEDE